MQARVHRPIVPNRLNVIYSNRLLLGRLALASSHCDFQPQGGDIGKAAYHLVKRAPSSCVSRRSQVTEWHAVKYAQSDVFVVLGAIVTFVVSINSHR